MTGKEPHKDIDRLARLYREQGDIEPGPGVDQRIRERARTPTRRPHLPRPARWLGGMAVAASLFVVVSIVTNIQPPEAELPSTEGARDHDTPLRVETDAAQSPAAGDRSSSPSELSTKPEPAPLKQRSGPLQPATTAGDESARQARSSAPEETPGTARERQEWSGESRRSPDDLAEMEEELAPASEFHFDLAGENRSEAERALWLIERRISDGNAERARTEIEKFRERYPEHEFPPELIAELEKLESSTGPD